jgi:hypothetical protein
VTICYTLAVFFICALAGAEPEQPDETPALQYRFDQARPGLAVNRADPGIGDLRYVSRSAYGSWRGREVWPDDERVYPHLVPGRDGLLSALRTGTAGETIGQTDWRPDFEAGYSICAWLRVYDHGEDFGGAIANLGSGYKSGWRLEFTKAHWVKEGRLSLVCGTKDGSTGIESRPFPPEVWHHVALVAGNGKMSLYVNGELAGVTEEPLQMPRPQDRVADFRICGKWYSNAGLLDYRFDELAGFERPLTGDEIKTLYEAGKPADPAADLSAREASLNALCLEIRKDTWGYFPAGQPIKLTFSASAGGVVPERAVYCLSVSSPATPLHQRLRHGAGQAFAGQSGHGVTGPLPAGPLPARHDVAREDHLDFPSALPATIEKEIVIADPGLYRLSMRLLDTQGRTLKAVVYPLGITKGVLPPTPGGWLGAENVAMHPEPLAVGIGLNRVICDWAELEPAKDEYDWTQLDFMLLDPRNEGLDLLVCFTGMPTWLGGDPNAALDDRGVTAYRTIWQKLTARYPQVRFWEVGDMPDRAPGNWRVRVPRYRQQLAIAATEIRKHGKTVLGGGAWNASPEWTEAVLADGGSAHLDILTIRTMAANSARGELAELLSKTRAAGVAAGCPDLPIWNTGLGARSAEALVRNIQTHRAAGIERLVIAPGIIDGDPSRQGMALIEWNTNKEDRADRPQGRARSR